MGFNLKDIRKSFVHVFGGSVLTESFFVKNTRFILAILIIMFVFINHRYTVMGKMTTLEKAQRELKDAKFEALTISAKLTEASRQTEIEKRIQKEGLDIKISNEPIYKIQRDAAPEKK